MIFGILAHSILVVIQYRALRDPHKGQHSGSGGGHFEVVLAKVEGPSEMAAIYTQGVKVPKYRGAWSQILYL